MSFSRPTTQLQPPPPQQPPPTTQTTQTRQNLEITIISGKHLKNVNWKNGDLKPYVIFWVDPDNKLTTKSDDSSNTKPIWNQRFTLPIPTTSILSDVVLTLEVFHSITAQTPKPFVGSAQVNISSLLDPGNPNIIRNYDLLRPSGRPQGKIRLKLGVKEQPLYNYQSAPHSLGYGYPYSVGYYPGGYYSPPPPPPAAVPSVMRSFSDRNMSYGAAPSAPVDYSPYETRFRGVGTGFGVGAVTGMLGGVVLDDQEKNGERVEENYLGGGSVKDDFSEYRADY